MSPEEKGDYDEFLEGVFFFLKMKPEEIIEHIKVRGEEAFPQLRHFGEFGSRS